jgi:hypothetical protein
MTAAVPAPAPPSACRAAVRAADPSNALLTVCGNAPLFTLLHCTGWSYLLAAAGGALAVVGLNALVNAAAGCVKRRVAAVRASLAYQRRYHMPPGDDGDSNGDGPGTAKVRGWLQGPAAHNNTISFCITAIRPQLPA